jgi:Ser/Thr protein kinase RdoA (MazF antagonist)
MGKELAEPDWPPLTEHELRQVLAGFELAGSGEPAVLWRSPRPMSAAALVRVGEETVFVKRHHVRVRTSAQLAAEHAFAGYLRARGQPVPAVIARSEGGTVLRRGDFRYEVHQPAEGLDLYRDAVSWSPYLSTGHAYAAGVALARLHRAASGFGSPARPPAALMNSCQIVCSADPASAVDRLVASRPGVAAYLDGRPWRNAVIPLIVRAAPMTRSLPSQWGHGDWHPSNLTWTSAAPDAQVAGVFDFGLANRTSAVHDLAIALERSVVAWLDLAETGSAGVDFAAADALLAGYQSVRPLSAVEAVALPLVLPVVHVEYALSEIEYFTDVVHSAGNADLAYGYLVGHCRWFAGPEGRALLGHLARSLCPLFSVRTDISTSLLLGESDRFSIGRRPGYGP